MTPRGRKRRWCLPFTGDSFFKPSGVPLVALEAIDLGHDELEAMRLCDFDDLDQEQAAGKMNVSRGTVQRLLYSGRKKLLDAICNSKAIKIIGGEHIVTPSLVSGMGIRGRWRRRGRI